MFKKSSAGLQYLLLAVAAGLITAAARIETTLYYLHPGLLNVVRTTAYISAFITGMFSFILILFAFYIVYLLLKKNESLVENFSDGLKYFSIVLIAGEAVKLLLVFLLLKDELLDVSALNINSALSATMLYKLQTPINILILAGAVIAFVNTVKEKSGKVFGVKEYAQLAIPLFALLVFASAVHF